MTYQSYQDIPSQIHSEQPLSGVIAEGLKLYAVDFLSRRYGRNRATRHEFMTRDLEDTGNRRCGTEPYRWVP